MNAASGRVWRRGFAVVALALASGGAGWVMGQRGHEGREFASARVVPAPVATVPVASDRRTLAVDESFGDRALFVHAVADEETTSEAGASCEPADDGAGILDVALLERTLAEGTETERHGARNYSFDRSA